MSTEDFKAQALRIAAELTTAYPHNDFEQIVALVAYSYALGSRDGFSEAAALAEQARDRLLADIEAMPL